MSIDSTLLTLFQELMADYDSTVDTSAGSSFYEQVLVPFLTRIGGSPLEVDLETFLVERLNEELDDIDTSYFSGIRDLIIRPAVVMLEPVLREIRAVRVTQSLDNYDQMTRDELNAHLANYFTELSDGEVATGSVRLYYTSPRSVVVTPYTRFSAGSGLDFYPTVVQSISAAQMTFNQSGSLYYYDVTVRAEEAGESYNVSSGDINSVQGLSGVVRVANLVDFTNATEDETKAEGAAKAQNSITLRANLVDRGIKFVLSENFPWASTVQVIGKGDDEMVRDIIQGPVNISSIPGGVAGKSVPYVGSGNEVHIGGFTDVYVHQDTLVSDTLDIQNVEDWGYRIYVGTTGYTQPGAAVSSFCDEYGLFTSRGIQAGDFLRVGTSTVEISAVFSDELQLSSMLAGSLYGQTYEVVRETSGFITVPLYDLVAEDSSGDPVLDSSGDPVQAIPGDEDKGALQSGGSDVVKTENIASSNVELPLVRVASVEFLDPLTLEATGVEIPMANLLLIKSTAAFTGGTSSTKALGTLRLYFRDAVAAWASYSNARFTYQAWAFRPATETSGTANVSGAGSTITLESADYTGDVTVGDRISFNGNTYMVTGGITYGAPDTTVTVRETFSGAIASKAFTIHQGVSSTTISQDMDSGLYYWDLAVESVLNGTAGNIAADLELTEAGTNVEGWKLESTYSALSFSVLDLPYLQLSDWVSDTIDLTDVSTAYALRVNYEYASQLEAIQTLFDSDDYRVVSEDVLIRHFLPAYVRGAFTAAGVTAAAGTEAVQDHVNALSPTVDLDVSDLVSALHSAGANYVELPVTLVSLAQAADRTWTATLTEDTLGSSRVQHFLTDEDYLTVSVSS